jgi:hypothetical protein
MADNKRQYTVVTIDMVRGLIEDQVPFTCRYEFIGLASLGRPKYHCIYTSPTFVGALCKSKISRAGAVAREFDLWPGLFRHHHEFGDGRILCINSDYTIESITPDGLNAAQAFDEKSEL